MIISINYFKENKWIDYECERAFFHIRYIYLYTKEGLKTKTPYKSIDINLVYEIDIKNFTTKQN